MTNYVQTLPDSFNLQNRITTFSQSKRLKELGLRQNIELFDFVYIEFKPKYSKPYWIFGVVAELNYWHDDEIRYNVQQLNSKVIRYSTLSDTESIFKAFDLQQINQSIPKKIDILGKEHFLFINPYPDDYKIGYGRMNNLYSGLHPKVAFYTTSKIEIEAKINLLLQLGKSEIIKHRTLNPSNQTAVLVLGQKRLWVKVSNSMANEEKWLNENTGKDHKDFDERYDELQFLYTELAEKEFGKDDLIMNGFLEIPKWMKDKNVVALCEFIEI